MAIRPVKLTVKDFQLPSCGFGYKQGVLAPSIEHGILSVYPMSTRLEIQTKNIDTIINGSLIVDICNECVPNQVLEPSKLFYKDIEALMIFMRSISSGDTYNFSFKHDCQLIQDGKPVFRYEEVGDAPDGLTLAPEGCEIHNTPSGRKIVIAHPIESSAQTTAISLTGDVIANMKRFETDADGGRSIIIPEGNVVSMSPIPIVAQVDAVLSVNRAMAGLDDTLSDFSTAKELALLQQSIASIAACINDIDSNTSKTDIIEYLGTLPVSSLAILSTAYAALDDFGIRDQHSVTCLNCKKTVRIELPLDPFSFFSMR